MEINSIEEFVQKSELYKAERIVPTWLERLSKRKFQHRLRFASDCYVMRTKNGNIIGSFVENGSILKLFGVSRTVTLGSPYSDGNTLLINLNGEKALNGLNQFIETGRIEQSVKHQVFNFPVKPGISDISDIFPKRISGDLYVLGREENFIR